MITKCGELSPAIISSPYTIYLWTNIKWNFISLLYHAYRTHRKFNSYNQSIINYLSVFFSSTKMPKFLQIPFISSQERCSSSSSCTAGRPSLLLTSSVWDSKMQHRASESSRWSISWQVRGLILNFLKILVLKRIKPIYEQRNTFRANYLNVVNTAYHTQCTTLKPPLLRCIIIQLSIIRNERTNWNSRYFLSRYDYPSGHLGSEVFWTARPDDLQ